MTSNTVRNETRKDLVDFQYWWNELAFEVYCAVRSNNKSEYDKATETLQKFEARVKRDYPKTYDKLKRPYPKKHPSW